MAEILRFVGICLLTIILAQTLKGTNPVGSFLIIFGAVLLLASLGLNGMQNILEGLQQLRVLNELSEELYLPVVKVVGIAATVHIAAAVCRDAGAAALAAQLELAGTCAALIVCLPLFEQIVVVVDALLD